MASGNGAQRVHAQSDRHLNFRFAVGLVVAFALAWLPHATAAHAEPLPVNVPGNWQLSLNEEFTSAGLNKSLWTPEWPHEPMSGQCTNPNNVSQPGNGELDLYVKAEESTCYGTHVADTGSTVESNPSDGVPGHTGFTYSYGYVEWRVYVAGWGGPEQGCPVGGCIPDWPAVWSFPVNEETEIDTMEGLNGEACYHFWRHLEPGSYQVGGCAPKTKSYAGWHTYGVDWEPGVVTVYYDGTKMWEYSSSDIKSTPQYLIMTEVPPVHGGHPVYPDGIGIDYVRVWQHPKPTATTSAASEVTGTSAKLNGSVNPNGFDTHYYFEYGPTTSYGNAIPAPPGMDLGAGTSAISTWNNISGLTPGTTYHYRVVASSSNGVTYGSDQTVKTGGAPVVFYNLTGGLNQSWLGEKGSWNWTYWQLGIQGSPALVMSPNGNEQFVYYNVGGHLYERKFSGGSWTTTPIGESITGSPAAVIAPNGERYIFYNHGGVLYETWLNWKGWNTASIGHAISSDPAVMVNPANEAFVFYNYNGTLQESSWTGTAPWGYQYFEKSKGMIGKPAVGEAANGEQYVFYNREGVLCQTWLNWQGWNTASLSHGITGSPGAAVNSNSHQYVFYNYNGTLQESWWNGTAPWNYRYWESQKITGTPSVNVSPSDDEGWVFFASNGSLQEGNWRGPTVTFEGRGHGINAADAPSSAVTVGG